MFECNKKFEIVLFSDGLHVSNIAHNDAVSIIGNNFKQTSQHFDVEGASE